MHVKIQKFEIKSGNKHSDPKTSLLLTYDGPLIFLSGDEAKSIMWDDGNCDGFLSVIMHHKFIFTSERENSYKKQKQTQKKQGLERKWENRHRETTQFIPGTSGHLSGWRSEGAVIVMEGVCKWDLQKQIRVGYANESCSHPRTICAINSIRGKLTLIGLAGVVNTLIYFFFRNTYINSPQIMMSSQLFRKALYLLMFSKCIISKCIILLKYEKQ